MIASQRRARSHGNILNAALTIAVLTAIVRIASVAKELVVASRFGTGDELDAFLISLVVPVAIVTILTGAVGASFIPIYIETKQNEGSARAQSLFQSVIGWALLCLLVLTVLVIVTAPWYLPVLGSGFRAEKLNFTLKLFWMNSPLIILGGLAAVCSAALNAERKFVITAAAPLITPALTVIYLYLFPARRVFALTTGIVEGSAIELLILIVALHRVGITISPRWPCIDAKIRRLAGQFVPVMSGAVLNSGNVVVDQAMAAMLATGSVAALNYGNRVVQFPLVLLSAPLGTALMPYLSQLAAAKDWLELKRIVHRSIRLTGFITLPLTVLLILFSRQIVSLTFYRGAFSSADVFLVSRVQAFYALQIPAYVVSIIVVRLISSLQANQLLLFATIINLLTNIILNFAFMRWMGLPGIALSTSVVYLFSTIFWYSIIMRRLRELSAATT